MAYLGLVPSEKSSGERQHRGRITKAGSPARALAAGRSRLARPAQPRPRRAPLQAWAGRVALRRGKRVAVVALARRLAGVLYVMWRDGADYCAGARPDAGGARRLTLGAGRRSR
jgi:transposase